MASKALLIAVAVVATVVGSTTAEVFFVGDSIGWRLNFDYQSWAAGKEFHVGDTLVFVYPPGVHNVVKVNGTGFQSCSEPDGALPLTSGKDVIRLTSPGQKWYICSIGAHCEFGPLKLSINVLPRGSESDSPAPASSLPLSEAPRNGMFGRLIGKFVNPIKLGF